MLFENLHIFEISSVTRYEDEKRLYPMKNTGRLHCGFLLNEKGVEYYHFKDKDITVTPGTPPCRRICSAACLPVMPHMAGIEEYFE